MFKVNVVLYHLIYNIYTLNILFLVFKVTLLCFYFWSYCLTFIFIVIPIIVYQIVVLPLEEKMFQISMKFVALLLVLIFSMFATTAALSLISLSRKFSHLHQIKLYRSLHAVDAADSNSHKSIKKQKKKRSTISLSTLPIVENSPHQQLSVDDNSLCYEGLIQPHNATSIAQEKDIFFVVNGEPICLQRHRVLRSGISYNPSSKQQKAFLESSRQFLPSEPLQGPLEMSIVFYFKRPLNHYGTGKNNNILKPGMDMWHSKRKDLDNLVKFVLDSLNKVAYLDDSQVAVLKTAKLYTNGEARSEVNIRRLRDCDDLFGEPLSQ